MNRFSLLVLCFAVTFALRAQNNPPAAGKPIHISGGIMAGTILTKGMPQCGDVVMTAHTSGTTVMHAIIGTDGHIAKLDVIFGAAVLRTCVLETVRQWTYRPYLLHGVPTEVDTTITITMDFNGPYPPPPASTPIRLSGGVIAGMLLTRVQPIYPPEARIQHINGAVVLHVIIGTDGRIITAEGLSGPEMLRASWLEAVKQWTYKPYLLNGVPTEVDATITGSLQLSAPPVPPAQSPSDRSPEKTL